MIRVVSVPDCLRRSGRCCKEIMLRSFLTEMYDFCFTRVGTQGVFVEYLGLNVFFLFLFFFAFCFWSVAKCLPNTDCAQQWIKKGPLF